MRLNYMHKADAEAVRTRIRRTRSQMKPGDKKTVRLPDGQRPLTLRIATPEELARIRERKANIAPGEHKRPIRLA